MHVIIAQLTGMISKAKEIIQLVFFILFLCLLFFHFMVFLINKLILVILVDGPVIARIVERVLKQRLVVVLEFIDGPAAVCAPLREPRGVGHEALIAAGPLKIADVIQADRLVEQG